MNCEDIGRLAHLKYLGSIVDEKAGTDRSGRA